MKRSLIFVALAASAVAAACSGTKKNAAPVQTAAVARRDIVIDAQASGAVEPINVIEVKSKASGLITRMTVETGDQVRPGELLVQVDTRDVQNQYSQAEADVRAAEARLQVAVAQKRRADEMFGARVITAQEHESAALDFANAEAQLVRMRASLDLAKQRMEDATVTAPVAGTIIEKTVSLGQVITSATGSVGGGTTLLKMADLNRVRMRALFNETDIGQVRGSQPATVIVDAYPDRRFTGTVEKIEPQAVVQQGVTMFPVLVTLSNVDGALKPGMNGEVSVLIEERTNVLSVPNDAVRNAREAVATAPLLGLDPDVVQAQLRSQFTGRTAGGMTGAGATSGGRATQSGRAANGGQRVTVSPGDVALQPQQGTVSGQQGPGTGRQGGGQGFQMPDVSDKACAAVTSAMDKKPAEAKKLDALRERMRSGEMDRAAGREETQKLYAAIGVDARVATACRMREMQGGAGMQAAPGAQRSGQRERQGGAPPSSAPAAANPAQAAPTQLQLGNVERPGSGPRVRSGLVFVAKGNTFEPRMVMLGAGNFDYTEVVSGLEEGEQVALLAALSLQAARQQQTDRFRQMQGGGVPGMSQNQTPGGARGAPRGGR